jgi:hypothetical protein
MAFTYKQGKLTLDADFQFADLKDDLVVTIGPARSMNSGYRQHRISLKLNGKDIYNIQSESPCGVFQKDDWSPIITVGGEGFLDMYRYIETEVEKQFVSIYNKANPETPITEICKKSTPSTSTSTVDGVEKTYENKGALFATTNSYGDIVTTLAVNRELFQEGKFEQSIVKTDKEMDAGDFAAFVKAVAKVAALSKGQRVENVLGTIYFPRNPNIKSIKFDDIVDKYQPIEKDTFVSTIKESYNIVNATFTIPYLVYNEKMVQTKPASVKCYASACVVVPRRTRGGAASALADMFADLNTAAKCPPIDDQDVNF